jgi:hypothetical protein
MSRFRQDPSDLRRLRSRSSSAPRTPSPADDATPDATSLIPLSVPATPDASPDASTTGEVAGQAANSGDPPAATDAPASRRWRPALPSTRRRFPSLSDLVMLLAAVLVIALIIAGVSRVGIGPLALSSNGSATVRFTRTMQVVHVARTRLTASQVGGAQVAALVQAATLNQSSAPIDASFSPGQQVAFDLSVTNPATSGPPISSASGLTITSGNGQLTCTTTADVQVAARATVTQHCQLPPRQVPAATWSDSAGGLAYTGNSPAGGAAPYYFVPTPCGDSTAVETAAKKALDAKIAQLTPQGALVTFGPAYIFPDDAIGCTPQAGTIRGDKFTYTVDVEGTATQTTVNPTDVENYQLQQLQHAANNVAGSYVVATSSACPGGPAPVPGTAAQAFVSLECPAGGVAGWNWDIASLNQLATTLRGLSPDDAAARLSTTTGIQAGSVHITLSDGADNLPFDASHIHFQVDDDAPPVLVVGLEDGEAACANQHYPSWSVGNGGGKPLTWSATTDHPGVNLSVGTGTITPSGQPAPITLTGTGPLTGPIHVNFTSNGGEASITIQCVKP